MKTWHVQSGNPNRCSIFPKSFYNNKIIISYTYIAPFTVPRTLFSMPPPPSPETGMFYNILNYKDKIWLSKSTSICCKIYFKKYKHAIKLNGVVTRVNVLSYFARLVTCQSLVDVPGCYMDGLWCSFREMYSQQLRALSFQQKCQTWMVLLGKMESSLVSRVTGNASTIKEKRNEQQVYFFSLSVSIWCLNSHHLICVIVVLMSKLVLFINLTSHDHFLKYSDNSTCKWTDLNHNV